MIVKPHGVWETGRKPGHTYEAQINMRLRDSAVQELHPTLDTTCMHHSPHTVDIYGGCRRFPKFVSKLIKKETCRYLEIVPICTRHKKHSVRPALSLRENA